MSGKAQTSWMARVVRVAASLLLLGTVLAFVDLSALGERLSSLDPFWLVLAVLATVPQVVFSAVRWRLTAARLGADLPFRMAVAEYFLGTFANQVLPGGVMGDVARAVRHGRRGSGLGRALQAVVYERTAGQAVLIAVMVPGLACWPLLYGVDDTTLAVAMVPPVSLLLLISGLALAGRGAFGETRAGAALRRFLSEGCHALTARDVVLKQGVLSVTILAGYLVCFYCAGRAVGVNLSGAEVFTLLPAVLLSMAVPITVAGWGVREASAAGLWALSGMPPESGVAMSVAYGAVLLLSTLPAPLLLLPSVKRYVADDG